VLCFVWRENLWTALAVCGLLSLGATESLAQTKLRPKGTFQLTVEDRAHWAFQPLRSTPGVRGVDDFIVESLAAEGMNLEVVAAPETLIRRVTLDLIGLPPTPEAVDAFVRDPSERAYERLIEELLASPRYGERWGRHWLDLVRFAETDGFEHDAVRPHAWQYRDYVIRSFNDDKPYDRFVKEQIAGDELWPEAPEALIATGYALLGPDMVDSSDQVQRRHNTLNDITDTTGLVFLGLTMGCARCHDHKMEPISQSDYYQMQAYFADCSLDRERPVPSASQRRDYEVAMQRYEANEVVQELAKIEAPIRESLRLKKLAKLSPEAQVAHSIAEEKRTAEEQNLVLETAAKVKVTSKEVGEAIQGELRGRYEALQAAVRRLGSPPKLPLAMALSKGKPQPTYVLRRGEYSMPLDEVRPQTAQAVPAVTKEASRKALADWIASPSNPLTARVIVNRIWQHHFGRGIVASPSDFGLNGARPTHPELLDWLADEFVRSGWSVKAMHRLIMKSRTYRQAMAVSEAETQKRLYAGWQPLRLEGEIIRDSLLAISGTLNLAMYGPGVFPPVPREVVAGSKGGWSPNDRAAEYSRRSIYIFSRRNLRFPFLEVFDAPDNNLSCAVRERSTTAPQALTLLNATEVMTAAEATAHRLSKAGSDPGAQVVEAYRLILSRAPTQEESMIGQAFLKESPLVEYCRALFNLNEFVYVN
jgi:hypothetical protein